MYGDSGSGERFASVQPVSQQEDLLLQSRVDEEVLPVEPKAGEEVTQEPQLLRDRVGLVVMITISH